MIHHFIMFLRPLKWKRMSRNGMNTPNPVGSRLMAKVNDQKSQKFRHKPTRTTKSLIELISRSTPRLPAMPSRESFEVLVSKSVSLDHVQNQILVYNRRVCAEDVSAGRRKDS